MPGDGLRADFVFSSNASRIVPYTPERVVPLSEGYYREERRLWCLAYPCANGGQASAGHFAIIGVSAQASCSNQPK